MLVPVLAAAGTLLVLGNDTAVPATEARGWILDNTDPGQRLVVADTMTGGFAGAGWNDADVLSYGELTAWRDADVVVTGPATGDLPAASPVGQAIANSVVVASFGDGDQRMDVRMVTPQGAVLASAADAQAAAERVAYGSELARNPALQISDANRALLTDGRVDPRVVVLLATLIADGGITVSDFPAVAGEQTGPLRQVSITKLGGERVAFDGELARDTRTVFENLTGPYAPDDVRVTDGAVTLEYPFTLDPLSE